MLDLDSNLMGLLEGTLFLPIRAVDVIKWLCIVIGIGLGVTAAVLKFRKNRMDKVHILNREEGEGVEEQSRAEFEPNPTLRIEDLEKHQQTHDPSYIPDNRQNTRFVQNELSAAALMKTVSTMTSANGAKQPTVDRTTSPPNLIVRNMEEPSLYFIPNKGNGFYSNGGFEVSELVNPATTIDITTNSPEEEVYPGLSSLQVRSPLELSGGSPAKSLELQLSSERVSLKEPQLESTVENLRRGDSSNLSTSTRRITSPLESPQDQVVPSHLITDNINTSFLETNATSFHRKETVETPEDSRPTTAINEVDTKDFSDSDLFGETISRNSTEDDSSAGKEFNNGVEAKSETQEVTKHIINNNVSIGEETQKSTQPTDQEMKLVEKDINELIAEIAQLMPKNK